MSRFTIFWITWLVAGFAVEVFALIRLQQGHPGGTLSEHIWQLRGTGYHSLLIFFLLWTIWHFIWEGGEP